MRLPVKAERIAPPEHPAPATPIRLEMHRGLRGRTPEPHGWRMTPGSRGATPAGCRSTRQTVNAGTG
jgi:hypothetical protein